MIKGKMCVNVSGEKLMCRFDPSLDRELAKMNGYEPVIMKGKESKDHCYVKPAGCKSKKEFEYWINLCLDFIDRAKSSKRKKMSIPISPIPMTIQLLNHQAYAYSSREITKDDL